jgi:drug/metabolite transporter (DMT)-like permease
MTPRGLAAHGAPVGLVIAALLAVYIIWGSTYLAIRFVVEEMPPFISAGARFLIAGTALMIFSRLRGAAWPKFAEWRAAAVIAFALFLVGHGLVVWVEQFMSSGLTALVVATVPVWMTVILVFDRSGHAPGWAEYVGLVLGMVGVSLLVNPFAGTGNADVLGVVLLVVAAFAWAAGSLYSRRAPRPASHSMGTAAQMLLGGVLLFSFGAVTGEFARLNMATITAKSVLSLLYLTVFGSLIAFSAYNWLLQSTRGILAGTYAFVNPAVALILGALLAGEQLGTRDILASAVILAGVVLITLAKGKFAKPAPVAIAAEKEG